MRIIQAIKAFFNVLLHNQTAADAKALPLDETISVSQPVPDSDELRFSGAAALLQLMQRESRFLDFISEDIKDVPDAQVGAVARLFHKDLKQVFARFAQLEPVFLAEEGQKVEVGSDLSPLEVRLHSDRDWKAPYRARLVHRGYRLKSLNLPDRGAKEAASILAPAILENPEELS